MLTPIIRKVPPARNWDRLSNFSRMIFTLDDSFSSFGICLKEDYWNFLQQYFVVPIFRSIFTCINSFYNDFWLVCLFLGVRPSPKTSFTVT